MRKITILGIVVLCAVSLAGCACCGGKGKAPIGKGKAPVDVVRTLG